MDYLRYHSFLNAVTREFEGEIDDVNQKTQKRLLSFTMKIIDAFTEIYGDHDLKMASNNTSEKLVRRDLPAN